MFTASSCFSLPLKLFTLASNLIVDGDSVTEGIHSTDMDDDDAVLMLPSSQLSELDQAYKSGGQDAARQLLQRQTMEQVCYKPQSSNTVNFNSGVSGAIVTIVRYKGSKCTTCDVMHFFFSQNNRLLQDACKEGVDPTILELLLSESPSLCDVNGRDKVTRLVL